MSLLSNRWTITGPIKSPRKPCATNSILGSLMVGRTFVDLWVLESKVHSYSGDVLESRWFYRIVGIASPAPWKKCHHHELFCHRPRAYRTQKYESYGTSVSVYVRTLSLPETCERCIRCVGGGFLLTLLVAEIHYQATAPKSTREQKNGTLYDCPETTCIR
jgi:hypothetical protein